MAIHRYPNRRYSCSSGLCHHQVPIRLSPQRKAHPDTWCLSPFLGPSICIERKPRSVTPVCLNARRRRSSTWFDDASFKTQRCRSSISDCRWWGSPRSASPTSRSPASTTAAWWPVRPDAIELENHSANGPKISCIRQQLNFNFCFIAHFRSFAALLSRPC